jgi:hypothetical protein
MLVGVTCDQPVWSHSQENPIIEVKCLQWSFIMSQNGTRSDDWITNFCCTVYLRLLSNRCHSSCLITSNVLFSTWSVWISGLQTLRRTVSGTLLTKFKISRNTCKLTGNFQLTNCIWFLKREILFKKLNIWARLGKKIITGGFMCKILCAEWGRGENMRWISRLIFTNFFLMKRGSQNPCKSLTKPQGPAGHGFKTNGVVLPYDLLP